MGDGDKYGDGEYDELLADCVCASGGLSKEISEAERLSWASSGVVG